MKNEKFPLTVTEQGGSAKVRKIRQTKNGSEYVFYMVDYVLLGKRKQEWHTEFNDAKRAASNACKKIANGEQHILQLNSVDRLIYIRAIEALKTSQIPLDVAASEFAQAISILSGKATLLEAAREYAARHAAGLIKIKVAEAVEKLIEHAKRDGKFEGRQNSIKSKLGRFAGAFNSEIHTLTPKLIGDYLAALPFEERTKANHRDMLGYFFRWCVTQHYLPKDADLLEGVQEYSKPKYGEMEILTSDEMAKLLEHASDDLLPFLVLCGFAGLRSAEVQRLDWRAIDFEDG